MSTSKDKLVWRNNDGHDQTFSVSNVWESIRSHHEIVPWYKVVWFTNCIPRHSLLLWTAMHGKLKTQDRLSQWDVNRDLAAVCTLCGEQADSHRHLFFECNYSTQVWNHLKIHADISNMHGDYKDVVEGLNTSAQHRSCKSTIAKLVLAASIYFLWQERNARMFTNQKRTSTQLQEVLYDDGEVEVLDLKQEQWELAETASRLSTFEIKVMYAGKGLLILPSSTAELLNVLEHMEKRLNRVKLHKGKAKLSESMKYAMRPLIEALVAKELLRHPDTDVNISVACCICDVLTIMDDNAPYNDEQMKDFFELAVITFEKLFGECSTKFFKVLRTLSHLPYLLLKSDLLLKGLIVRLFKQFLTSADSNSYRAVFEMKQIMINIIEQSELLDLELVDLLVTSVRKEIQITSPACWKLGNEVLKKCAAKLKPHIQDKVANGECNSQRESTESETNTIKWTKNAIKNVKLGCLDGSRNSVQPVRSSKEETKHTVNIDSEVEKKTLSSDDPSMPSTSVIEVSSDDDNEELIDFTGKQMELLENVYATPDSVFNDDGDKSLVDLKQKNLELVEKVAHSVGQAPPAGDIISVQGYSVKQSIAPILEAIFRKHGDILANCSFQIASVRSCFLEVICEVVRLIETSDVATIISKMEEIESKVSQAEAANIDVSWLRAQLKTIHTRNEALEKTTSLMEMKVNIILVKRAARTDLVEGCEELVAAQERCVKAEECIKVLDKRADLVSDKPISTIISKRAARADMRERCREHVVAQEQFEKDERCVTLLNLVEEKLSKDILKSQGESTHG